MQERDKTVRLRVMERDRRRGRGWRVGPRAEADELLDRCVSGRGHRISLSSADVFFTKSITRLFSGNHAHAEPWACHTLSSWESDEYRLALYYGLPGPFPGPFPGSSLRMVPTPY